MDAMTAFKALVQAKVFEVRPDGTVWKLADRTNSGKLKPREPKRLDIPVGNGYLAISFWYQGKPYMVSAHRAVYEVLVGPIPQGLDINHDKGNKHNNDPQHLVPMTRGSNHLHAYRTGLKKPAVAPIVASLSERAKALRAKGMTYLEIAESLGVSQTTAFRAVKIK